MEAEKSRSYCAMQIEPEDQQRYCESRRVWTGVTKGIKTSNQDMATEYKTKLEDGQRAGKRERDAEGSGCMLASCQAIPRPLFPVPPHKQCSYPPLFLHCCHTDTRTDKHSHTQSVWVPRLFEQTNPADITAWRFKLQNRAPYDAGKATEEEAFEQSIQQLIATGELSVGKELMCVLNPSNETMPGV